MCGRVFKNFRGYVKSANPGYAPEGSIAIATQLCSKIKARVCTHACMTSQISATVDFDYRNVADPAPFSN